MSVMEGSRVVLGKHIVFKSFDLNLILFFVVMLARRLLICELNFFRVKENVENAGGPRLNSNFECFTIGFHSVEGARSMDHFNFRIDESRNNVVITPPVVAKLKHSGDNKVVNVYQKPR